MAVRGPSIVSVLVLLLLAFLPALITSTSTPSSGAATLHHIPLTRKPLRAARLFSFSRRPWLTHYYPSIAAHLANVSKSSSSSSTASLLPSTTTTTNTAQRALFSYSSPLHGSITPMGEYYVTLTFCGQPINVQIDTGSSTMAVPLKQCTNCRTGDNRLDLSRGCSSGSGLIRCDSSSCGRSTCSKGCGACSVSTNSCCSAEDTSGCAFQLLYADRSGVTGSLVRANVGVSTISTPLVFGGILKQSDFEAEQVDGIFGLAFKTLACNPSCVTPLLDTLVENGQVAHDIFSICTGAQGGVLTMGGSNPTLYVGSLSYVPFSRTFQSLFYKVDIEHVSIGGVQVSLPALSNGIVDSGTTLLVISETTYEALKKYFQTHYCHVPGLCAVDDTRETIPLSQSSKQRQQQLRNVDVIAHPHYPHADISNVNFGTSVSNMSAAGDTTRQGLFHQQHTWFEPGYCVDLNDAELSQLPTITLHLEGFDLAVESKVYMIPHYVQRGVTRRLYHCLGIAPLAGMERMPNDAIIGDTVLQKYFVEYDRENSRLGFAVAKNCVDPTAREPQPSATGSGGHSKSVFARIAGLLAAVPKVFWYVVVLGLVLIVAGQVMRRDGYDPISS